VEDWDRHGEIKPEVRQRVRTAAATATSKLLLRPDNPIMEDAVYDQLYRELQQLETQYPELITADSPTQRVGEKPLPSVRHKTPYSLENAFNIEELQAWQQRYW